MTTPPSVIYLDSAATTRTNERAAKEALFLMTELYANPSSAHRFGFEAETYLKNARKTLLASLGYTPADGTLVFTSCGTEADNMALFGAAKTFARHGRRLVLSDSEHPAVENAAKELEKAGCTVCRIPTKDGVLDLDYARRAITPDTFLVSCMTVNNETGALYDVASLRRIAKENAPDCYFHTDAVQAFTKVRDLASFDADLISISGHKIHAPKGIGALFIKKGVRIPALIVGGGQEGGLRSGTEALPNIGAFAAAAEDAMARYDERMAHFSALKARLCEQLAGNPAVRVHSLSDCPGRFAPHIMSIAVPGIRSEIMLRFLSERGICVSAGSACSSKHADNRVLTAFGLSDALADSTLRVSFSQENTPEQIDTFVQTLNEGIRSLAVVKTSGRS